MGIISSCQFSRWSEYTADDFHDYMMTDHLKEMRRILQRCSLKCVCVLSTLIELLKLNFIKQRMGLIRQCRSFYQTPLWAKRRNVPGTADGDLLKPEFTFV